MRLLWWACFACAAATTAQRSVALLGQRTELHQNQQLMAAWMSPADIGLLVTSIVIIVCVAMLVMKWRENTHRLDKLYQRCRGLHHSLLLEEQKNTKHKEKEDALAAMLSKEQEMRAETDRALAASDRALAAGDRELANARTTIATQKAEIKFLSVEDKALLRKITDCGRVEVDLEKKMFKFAAPIEFRAEFITPDMEEAPPATYENPQAAREIIGDLAEILNKYVKRAIILIEGHTSGGEQAMTHIGFQIACERAEKVVETLVELGVDRKRLESKGKPGLLGDNHPDVKLVTLSWGI